jgi:hypothetical protein
MKRILSAFFSSIMLILLCQKPQVTVTQVANITQTLNGSSHYMAIYVQKTHGKLVKMTTYYSLDHYVHIDDAHNANGVRDIQMYTCKNLGACGDWIDGGDIDSVGYLGQPHVAIHHNITLTFTVHGNGISLHQGHYEHGGEPEMEFQFADGFILDILIPSAPHLYAINIQGIISGHSHAAFLSNDGI